MQKYNRYMIELEDTEWLESLDSVFRSQGTKRVNDLLAKLRLRSQKYTGRKTHPCTTPYINTIPAENQPPYPGRQSIEQRLRSIIRWNAMAMVVRANKQFPGIGGHISTYASAATLFEVAFNHFLRANNNNQPGDIIFFQGHASPGIYARAFLEGRLDGQHLENFRRELTDEGGLPSYPHPRLMSDFWQFPTVSMGLSSIMAIYQARFLRYLENRGLKEPSDQRIWAFLGDGEMDEPESLAALSLASRNDLDNLIFVINCNLQRLDGPVRGNGKIIQELEGIFTGAGWNVIKVIWGSQWDSLLEKDCDGLLVERMGEVVDGQLQKYATSSGEYIRKDFWESDPRLAKLVKNYSDEDLQKLKRGGHDPVKVYAAYKAAVEHTGAPTVILAQTIKGYGLGEAGEGKNITHNQKKMNEEELLEFRSRFGIPIPDYEVAEAPFYRPKETSPEIKYIHECRDKLGGYVPSRQSKIEPIKTPGEDIIEEYFKGSGQRKPSTTMVAVKLLANLLKDPQIGKLIVPIIPDEARTFGMDPLFRQAGIYCPSGQKYEPVDKEFLLFYNEQKDGAVLEEGITEAGAMSSFIGAGTAYSTHGLNTIPFFLYYSLFGGHRMFDLIWAAGDAMARGFLLGGISGKSTLAGEGLQHQDGHTHQFFYAMPNAKAYDPAFAYELAVIVREGLYRMYEKQENLIYYITMMNETYQMPPMPTGCKEGILKGLYKFKASENSNGKPQVNLLGSGAILNEAIKAQEILESNYNISADVWSVTSYKELYSDAIQTDRWNMLNPEHKPKRSYLCRNLANSAPVSVAACDYLKSLPYSIAKWVPGRFIALGTDGYGRSETRETLRDYFEVDARYIVLAALDGLAAEGKIEKDASIKAVKDLGICPEKINPMSI